MTGHVRQTAPVVIAALAGCILLRLPALDAPLDRDLAAYATIGQNLGDGLLPYRDLFDHKQPLVYPLYALLDLVAPRSTAAIRLSAGLVAGALAALLFLGLRSRLGTGRAGIAAALAALLGATDWAEGTSLNTEHLLVVVETAAVVTVLRWGGSARWQVPVLVGVLAGLAMMAKGTGAFVVPALAAGLVLARARSVRSTLALLLAGAALPIGVWFACYAALGALDDLWYANITYNDRYLGRPFGHLAENVRAAWPVVLLAGAALALAMRRGGDRVRWTLASWTAGTLAAALISSRGFGHYFAPVVPAAAALLALELSRARGGRSLAAATVAAVIAAASAVDVGARYLGPRGDALILQQHGEQATAWVDAEVLGPEIRRRARRGDRLYAQGSDPNFYWVSGVRPAARFFYNLPLTLDFERWRGGVEQDVCDRLPRFYVTSTVAYPPTQPSCLVAAPYVAFARHGASTAYELKPGA